MRYPFALSMRRVWLAFCAISVVVLGGGCGSKDFSKALPGPQPDWSPNTVLPHIKHAMIRGSDMGSTNIRVDDPSTSRLVSVLRQTTGFHKGQPTAKPDMYLLVYTADGVRCAWNNRYPGFQYVSSTGELGAGNDWCKVPDEFRRWVLKVKAESALHLAGDGAPPKPRPTGRIIVQPHGFHGYSADGDPPNAGTPDAATAEVWFAVAKSPKASANWTALQFADHHSMHHVWPASYSGKTIYYRFRWKFDDGTVGPWSKTVSAKVLP